MPPGSDRLARDSYTCLSEFAKLAREHLSVKQNFSGVRKSFERCAAMLLKHGFKENNCCAAMVGPQLAMAPKEPCDEVCDKTLGLFGLAA